MRSSSLRGTIFLTDGVKDEGLSLLEEFMFKVTFVTRDYGSYAYEEEKHEFCFEFEKDANTFYNDLENFVDERTGGDSYVVSKSKPEKLNDVILYGYDPEIKKLYRLG